MSSTPVVSRSTSALSNAATGSVAWEDELGATSDQLFFVTSYTDFDKLAHGPRGSQAQRPLYVYRFHPSDGSLVLLNMHGKKDTVVNPAFSRYHPNKNVVYTCTEDIENNGRIFCYAVGVNGELTQLGDSVDAGGTSTCYLTIDKAQRHLLCVNYWDSTLAVIPISQETGEFLGPIKHMYDPKGGQQVVAAGRVHGGVNHSCNDASTIRMRQADPHSHALVLDPFVGCVCYVPDLGKDLIREFYYDRNAGKIELELNVMPSGLCTGMPDGPRYFEFHPKYNVAYVVNELSSTVAVFEVDRALLHEMANASARGQDMSRFKGRSTLRLIQSIKTIPNAFPTDLNTCGRICVHKSGRFVVVSNRGHESIAIFRVHTSSSSSCSSVGSHHHHHHNKQYQQRGKLQAVGYFHTRGETPRHFQFDASGQYLLVANQDSNSIAVFTFNLSSGEIKYTGNEYRVPSPNFVCCCPMHGDEDNDDEVAGGNISEEETLPAVVEVSHVPDAAATDSTKTLAAANNSKNLNDEEDLLATGSTSDESQEQRFPIQDKPTMSAVKPQTLSPPVSSLSLQSNSDSQEKQQELERELLQARMEISELKQKLSSLSAE